MTDTERLPPGTEIRHCPLRTCEWTHALPPLSTEEIAATMGEEPVAVLARHLMPAEDAIAAHLGTHTLLEWVQEIQQLREESERPRRLVAQWRSAAEALASTNAAWSSHFYDCANELERALPG